VRERDFVKGPGKSPAPVEHAALVLLVRARTSTSKWSENPGVPRFRWTNRTRRMNGTNSRSKVGSRCGYKRKKLPVPRFLGVAIQKSNIESYCITARKEIADAISDCELLAFDSLPIRDFSLLIGRSDLAVCLPHREDF
jgi:hypothetical protein